MVLSVLVCESSLVYAEALRRMLEYDRDISVPAICATAEEAISSLPGMKPDLVIMDAELPTMDGLEAVEEIMISQPLPVLVLSAHAAGSEKAASALAAGAVDVLAKEDLDLSNPAGAVGMAFRHRIRTLSRTRVIRHPRVRLSTSPGGARPGAPGPARRAAVIGICASAGGPHLLKFLLSALPADYQVPILIVQHLSPGFTEGLARWLDWSAAIPVGVAVPGTRLAPGAWLAPEGAHLTLTVSGSLARDRRVYANKYRPSGDVLLTSIAMAAGAAGVAVVLSGMGSDGAVGAAAVHRSGGLAIAQDKQSSVVSGMPEAALSHGVEVVLSPGAIASCLLALRHQLVPGARLWLRSPALRNSSAEKRESCCPPRGRRPSWPP